MWIQNIAQASNDTVPFQGRVHQAQENTGDEPSSDGPNGLLFRIVRFGGERPNFTHPKALNLRMWGSCPRSGM